MMGIGIGEMVLIAGIALIVIGPEKFPDFAKLVIRTIRDLRGYVDDIKSEVSKELKPIKDEMNNLSRIDPEKYIDSLTSDTSDDEMGGSSVNEEDQKIMDEASTYGEDPYGWEEGQEDYNVDKGAYPEETVGYGAVTDSDGDTANDAANDASDAPAASDTAETADEAAPAADPDSDAFETLSEGVQSDSNGEPDPWTGR